MTDPKDEYDEDGNRVWRITDEDSLRRFCEDLHQTVRANAEAAAGLAELLDNEGDTLD